MLYDVQGIKDDDLYSQKIKKNVICLISEDSNISELLKKIDQSNINIIINIIYENNIGSVNKLLSKTTPDIFMICMKNYNINLVRNIIEIRSKSKAPIVVISEGFDEVLALTIFKFGADEYWSHITSEVQIKNKIIMTILKSSIGMYSHTYTIQKEINDVEKENDIQISYVETFNNNTKFFRTFTPYEYKMLSILVDNAGIVVSRAKLAQMVRGRATSNVDRSVDNVISRIRKKLKNFSLTEYPIRSFSSVGYIFVGDKDNFYRELDIAVDNYLRNKR